MEEHFNQFRSQYLQPICKQYSDFQQRLTEYKYTYLYNEIKEKNRLRVLGLLTGFSALGAHYASRSLMTTAKATVIAFYGFGWFVYPELYNPLFSRQTKQQRIPLYLEQPKHTQDVNQSSLLRDDTRNLNEQ